MVGWPLTPVVTMAKTTDDELVNVVPLAVTVVWPPAPAWMIVVMYAVDMMVVGALLITTDSPLPKKL